MECYRSCYQRGGRGLPGQSSLAQLLTEHRGVRNIQMLPPLTEEIIFQWADEHFRRTGKWPVQKSGPVADTDYESWRNINIALGVGSRGLPGGSSLVKLLAAKRGRRDQKGQPRLTVQQILEWADEFQRQLGRWPTDQDGPIDGTVSETLSAVGAALAGGCRGFPGGSSLARVLAEHRSVRNRKALPPLQEDEIVQWALAHRARTGKWSSEDSGPVVDAPGETWYNITAALRIGFRGFPGGSSLYQLLLKHGREPVPR